MLTAYLNNPEYDLAGSFVIGDRATDVELAKNLGCKAILLQPDKSLLTEKGLENTCVLATTDWDRVAEFLFAGERTARYAAKTKETDIAHPSEPGRKRHLPYPYRTGILRPHAGANRQAWRHRPGHPRRR